MDHSTRDIISSLYKQSRRRVIFLDYDGTLVDYNTTPRNADPDAHLLSLLYALADGRTDRTADSGSATGPSKSRTDVVITTGRGYELLTGFFDLDRISLITEHGLHTKRRGLNWEAPPVFSTDWKTPVRALMQMSLELMPATNIEEKSYALVWHYRHAINDILDDHLCRLRQNLSAIIDSRDDLEILEGKNVIEVKANGYNKGIAATRYIAGECFDFVAAIGDDHSDEFMFSMLPGQSITARVGDAATPARFRLKDTLDVRDFLSLLI